MRAVATSAGPARERNHLVVLIPVFALALWASIFVYAHTTHGLTLTPDSASYLGTASNIRAGHGPTVPFTAAWDSFSPQAAIGFNGHVPSAVWPPGYPIALAAISTVAGSVTGAARALGVVLAFVNVVLIGVFTARLVSYRSAVIAAIPPALLLFVPDAWNPLKQTASWLGLHTAAMSDALQTALAAATLLALGTALTASGRRANIATVLAAVFAGYAFLTRYVGFAIVVTVFVAFAFFDRDRRAAARLVRATIVSAVALVPITTYLIWIRARGGGSPRSLGVHWLNGTGATLTTFGGEFFPQSFPWWLRTFGVLLLLAVVTAAAAYMPRRVRERWNEERESTLLLRLGLIFVVLNIVTLFATRTFFDAATTIDSRTLMATRGVAYAVVVASLYRLGTSYVPQVGVAVALAAVSLGLIFANWGDERSLFRAVTGRHPRSTGTARLTAKLPAGVLIGTNVPDQVYVLSGRRSLVMPTTSIYGSTAPNTNFDAQMREWAAILTSRPSYVVFGEAGATSTPGPDVFDRYMRLRPVFHGVFEGLYAVEPDSAINPPAGAARS